MTAALDPIAATTAISESYKRYLHTTFRPSDRLLAEEYARELDQSYRLTKGPILQAQAPYTPGVSLRTLTGEGVLHPGFLRLPERAFPVDRPLHAHQEVAIRKVAGGRNVAIATGTGSGKTEAFTLPIVNDLLHEADRGTLGEPGVRALLLYPMNALANDQMKRLQSLLLAFPEITFGRYVGDTESSYGAALSVYRRRFRRDPLPNEMIDRERMQQTPPHILLTNFAMLEYLLLRPDDSRFFDGPTGKHWRFIVLDEIHVYNGAKGAELAMLLRRVRERVNSTKRGALTCIGTSATLGRGKEDRQRVIEFVSTVFDEPFEWDDSDEGRQDLVEPQREELAKSTGSWTASPDFIQTIRSEMRGGSSAQRLVALFPPSAQVITSDEVGRVLFDGFAHEHHVALLQRELSDGSCGVEELASCVFNEVDDQRIRLETLVALVDICVAAQPSSNNAPLLPARYHFLIRSLEGAFVCRHPDHPLGTPRLRLSRHESCPFCADADVEAKMFEYGTCRKCGTGFAVGSQDESDEDVLHLGSAPLYGDNLVCLAFAPPRAADDDEDEAAIEGETEAAAKRVQQHLCSGCGAYGDKSNLGCGCPERFSEPVTQALPSKSSTEGVIRRCPVCAGRSNAPIILRFLTGTEAPVSVVATSLYQQIPPSIEDDADNKPGEGRKLLMFSDSRQDAAFFAPYLHRTYSQMLARRLVWRHVEAKGDSDARFGDYTEPIVKFAEQQLVLDPDDHGKNRTTVRSWLMREILAVDPRQSLEGVGLMEIGVAIPRQVKPPAFLLDLGFSSQEALDLARLLLRTLRQSAAVVLPQDVDIADPMFSPRNVVTTVRREQSARQVLSWMPSGSSTNRRLDYIKRLLERRSVTVDPKALLGSLWDDWLSAPGSGWEKVLADSRIPRQGVVRAIDFEWLTFLPTTPDHLPYRCDACGQVSWQNLSGVCPTLGCVGVLGPFVPDAENHYRRLYTDLEPIWLRVEEHTAQLATDTAARRQQEFLDGDINALSCSTTFELGVDVGEVQAVLLRNVPPTPANYMQRAGRAGRRSGAAALVVTFAQRRSHDRHYFDDPSDMIDGNIAPPIVTLTNTAIVRRHVHATAYAAYQRHTGEQYKTVDEFFMPADETAAAERFVMWLKARPGALGASVERIVPTEAAEELDIAGWGWVTALVEPDEESGAAWLARARDELRDDLAHLESEKRKAAEEEQYQKAGSFQRVRDTLARRPLIDFLAQRVVLPKYGFPVDVVELDVRRSGDKEAARVDLNRDLRMAIAEYAPGAKVVADKHLWEPLGLRIPPGRRPPTYDWMECSTCAKFSTRRSGGAPSCCSDPQPKRGRSGRFVIPMFGFHGRMCKERIGESRPPAAGFAISHFDDFAPGVVSDYEAITVGALDLEFRFSRRGRVTVINSGPKAAGYSVCLSCGHASVQERSKPRKKSDEKLPSHPRPYNTSSSCTGTLLRLGYGHQFLTDVIDIRPDIDSAAPGWHSALYALLAALPVLGVARNDMDGYVIEGSEYHRGSFLLFDNVPGGAGYARSLTGRLPEMFEAAYDAVATCDCGEDSSCYSCLRTYSNQRLHDSLSRADAMALLEPAAKGASAQTKKLPLV